MLLISSNWMPSVSRSSGLAVVAIAVVSVFGIGGGCQCYEEPERGWEFTQPVDAVTFDVPPDVPPDMVDTSDATDTEPDLVDAEDVIDPDGFTPPTNVIDNSNCGGRTSLVIDSDGTEWLGFHRGDSQDCADQSLTVAHHRKGSNTWQFEEIEEQEYLQVLAVTQANRPIVAYPDPGVAGELKVAHRRSDGSWRIETLSTRDSVTGNPGFDTAADEDHYYVSFAGDRSDRVEFFSFDTRNPNRGWEKQESLRRSNPSAAYERGLRADLGDSAYLVHRQDGRGSPFGLARYDKAENRWPQTEYFDTDDLEIHSFEVTDDFDLCMSGDFSGILTVTCGSMFDLDRNRWEFRNQPPVTTIPPSSMAVGADGSLYVAYHTERDGEPGELRVAKQPPESQDWRITTIFANDTSGVSTDVAPDGRLTVSFFACSNPSVTDPCPLKVVREAPENL